MTILRACVECGTLSEGSRCPEHAPKPWAGSTRRERTVSGWEQQRRAQVVLAVHDTVCHVCGRPCADQVDHVIPLAEGGEDTFDNLRPIHGPRSGHRCHIDKTLAEARRARNATDPRGARRG